MAIHRVGPRLTLAEQMARKPENRERPLALTLYTPGGRILRASEAVGKRVQDIQSLALRVEGLRKIDLGIKLVTIPAGELIFQGVRGVRHEGFKIAETPFTNGQFRKLLELKSEELSQIVTDPQERLERSLRAAADIKEAEDCPVVYIDNEVESPGIAKLLGLRLLTELEWERAAAGTNGRKFSFGDKFDRSKATFDDKGTRPVKAHEPTPEGVYDLSGDVWEWTSTPYGDIDLSDPKNPQLPQGGENKVLRGGYWGHFIPDGLQAAYRHGSLPEYRNNNIGVRFAEYSLKTARLR